MTQLVFLGDFSFLMGMALALLAGGLCYWLYRLETRRHGLPYGRLLPWLRSIAVALIVLMLTGPTLQHRYREGKPGSLTIVVDDSESMTLTDGQSENRYTRAIDGLLNVDPELLPSLAELFEVKIIRGSNRQTTELWSSTLERTQALPDSIDNWIPDAHGPSTELGDLLEYDQSSAIVLLSDGQINGGLSLVEAAQRIAFGQRPVFTVGFGKAIAPPDLAIASIELPDRLYRHDTLTGSLVLRDTMPTGQPFRIQAWCRENIVWEQNATSNGTSERSIAFSFPIDKLVENEIQSDRTKKEAMNPVVSAVPLEFQFRIVDCPGEANTENNQREAQLWGDLHRSRILLIDGRSRWETRYLKNVFERDRFWEINAVIAEPADFLGGENRLPIGDRSGQFPTRRDLLMDYDLVIIGEPPDGGLSMEQQRWIVDFVIESGGGLILIDGQRDAWLSKDLGLLSTLLPVIKNSNVLLKDLNQTATRIPVRLTPTGRRLAAMNIDADDEDGDGWNALPPFHWLASNEAIPGSDVLALSGTDSDHDHNPRPIFVTRRQGAGHVFYSATDETWRWRYKIADKIHQRFWNQMARWLMRTPYVVEAEFVSLDAGQMTYSPGQEVNIRCRIKKEDASPLTKATVEAIIHRDGDRELVLSLSEDDEIPGVYQGTATELASGHYTVSLTAAGVPQAALAVETRFVVAAPDSKELNEQASDLKTLRRVAELTGGQCILENDLPTLIDYLKPLSQGRIVQSQTVLWQSYYWFVPVIVCLSIEWWLRKRAGLI